MLLSIVLLLGLYFTSNPRGEVGLFGLAELVLHRTRQACKLLGIGKQ
jgi:hypothetical protein